MHLDDVVFGYHRCCDNMPTCRLTVAIETSDRDKLTRIAAHDDRSLSSAVRQLIRDAAAPSACDSLMVDTLEPVRGRQRSRKG